MHRKKNLLQHFSLFPRTIVLICTKGHYSFTENEGVATAAKETGISANFENISCYSHVMSVEKNGMKSQLILLLTHNSLLNNRTFPISFI